MNQVETAPMTIDNNTEIDYNRCVRFEYKIQSIPFYLEVLFNRHNNIMNFAYGSEYDDYENNAINYKVIRNLDNSKFVNKFLKLKSVNDYSSDGSYFDDRKNSFVHEYHNKQIYPIFNEIYNLSNKRMLKTAYPYNTDPNHLWVRAYGLNDYKNQYMFIFMERTKLNHKSNTIKTRTAAIEIYDAMLDLDDIIV